MNFNIKVDIKDALSLFILKKNKISDFNNIFKAIKPIVREQVKKRFVSVTNPDGSSWTSTLYDTGALFKDMREESNYPNKNNIMEITTTKVYGPVHNFGLTVHNLFGKGITHTFSKNTFAGIDSEGINKIEEKIKSIINES